MKDPIINLKRDLKVMGFQPNRLRGQNFLISAETRNRMVEIAELSARDIVFEIGPGAGVLTWALAKQAQHVHAVEIDDILFEFLQDRFPPGGNITIYRGDGLEKLSEFFEKAECAEVTFVSNLPYGLSSPVIIELSKNAQQVRKCVLMIQKEVADRIMAPPGIRLHGLLSVISQFRFEARVFGRVAPTHFYPAPHVDSAIISLTPLKNNLNVNWSKFIKLCKLLFIYKRKTISNNLKTLFSQAQTLEGLEKAGILVNERAECLTNSQILDLYHAFTDYWS